MDFAGRFGSGLFSGCAFWSMLSFIEEWFLGSEKMRPAALVLIVLVFLCIPTGVANPQLTDSRNLMWCSAKSGRTLYYSAWFRYSPSDLEKHRAKFRKDTLANYGLKSLDAPTCSTYLDTELASNALDADVNSQKKAGFKIVTTGWMPQ
jgi:hypothetical protein